MIKCKKCSVRIFEPYINVKSTRFDIYMLNAFITS